MPKGLNIKGNEECYYNIDPKTKCWNWKSSLSHNGYGVLVVNKKRLRASRYFYKKYKGSIPKEMVIDHLCRNRKCVNPEHLEIVTVKENIRRGNVIKLTIENIKDIKEKYMTENITQIELASIYNVNQSHINRLINERRVV